MEIGAILSTVNEGRRPIPSRTLKEALRLGHLGFARSVAGAVAARASSGTRFRTHLKSSSAIAGEPPTDLAGKGRGIRWRLSIGTELNRNAPPIRAESNHAPIGVAGFAGRPEDELVHKLQLAVGGLAHSMRHIGVLRPAGALGEVGHDVPHALLRHPRLYSLERADEPLVHGPIDPRADQRQQEEDGYVDGP